MVVDAIFRSRRANSDRRLSKTTGWQPSPSYQFIATKQLSKIAKCGLGVPRNCFVLKNRKRNRTNILT